MKHKINYNDPVGLQEIFRYKEKDNEFAEIHELTMTAWVGWEDIKSIEEYPYEDSWVTFPGPKYSVRLQGHDGARLILGDINEILDCWREFRNLYPLFTINEEEEDGMAED